MDIKDKVKKHLPEEGYKTDKKGKLDKLLAKAMSRKLFVLAVGTFFLYMDKIAASDWTLLALLYIGTQGAIDIIFRKLDK